MSDSETGRGIGQPGNHQERTNEVDNHVGHELPPATDSQGLCQRRQLLTRTQVGFGVLSGILQTERSKSLFKPWIEALLPAGFQLREDLIHQRLKMARM